MPEPIASSADQLTRLWNPSDDVCGEEPQMSSATWRLNDAPDPVADASSTAASADRGVRGPSVEVHAEAADIYAGAFALKAHDASGIDAEVFSVSLHQSMTERAAQIGMARVGGATDDRHWEARGEVFTAQARASTDNADGSTGLGASIGATVVGGEVTGTWGPVSVTGGVSLGQTYGASIGVRDSDHDGKTEYCGRVEFGAGTIGVCVEKRW